MYSVKCPFHVTSKPVSSSEHQITVRKRRKDPRHPSGKKCIKKTFIHMATEEIVIIE